MGEERSGRREKTGEDGASIEEVARGEGGACREGQA